MISLNGNKKPSADLKKILTGSFGNGANHDRWYCHKNATGCSNVTQQLRPSRCLGGQNPLEINLPRNASENKKQPVVKIRPVLFRRDFANPIYFQRIQWLYQGIHPRKGNTHPLLTKTRKLFYEAKSY